MKEDLASKLFLLLSLILNSKTLVESSLFFLYFLSVMKSLQNLWIRVKIILKTSCF